MANNDFDYDIFGTGSEPEEKKPAVEETAAAEATAAPAADAGAGDAAPATPAAEAPAADAPADATAGDAAPEEIVFDTSAVSATAAEPGAPAQPAAPAADNGFYDINNPDAEFEVPSEFKTGKQGRAADAVFGMGKKQKAPKNNAFSGAAAPQKAGPSTGVVVILLILFWPVGVYLMWKYQKFSKVARIVITAILAFFTLLSLLSSMITGCTNKDPDLPDYSQSVNADGTESNTAAATNNGQVTTGQEEALEAAKGWLKYNYYGPTGLKNALMGNGYSEADADYAVANCGADWTEQCNKKVENYVSYGYSESTIRFFLEGEGFTEEQLNNALALYPPTAEQA